ncbi:MAG TPA: lipid-A-disaccharide synthase [Gammaproteobacteria bacterium]|nr:lipid-A-disaccharide synthase [bacterium BMS3Abin11]GMT39789.1 MAG: lipid-A-disaccharide synthase [bacterium]HDH17106.1 lipid-A-disaccharide synthase [Gammaproteobacteria bacterium]HDZ78796.1 lipid-A-disaccharide synthase [Gammaproteobacteria bacterium]
MQGRQTFKIGIVAGEVSGDLLAAGLIRELRQYPYTFEFTGIAGPKMLEQACESLYPMKKLTLMGLDGLFGRLSEILQIRRSLVHYFEAKPPDLFIGIDAPDFNLGLEKKLRKAGIPVLHYVSPTVWAWRKYRLRSMRHSIDRILVLFPFELDFYRQHKLNAKLVGHPMVRDINSDPDIESLRKSFGLSLQKKVIALLPGSRRGEIQRMAGDFLQAAAELSGKHPNLQFVTAMPDSALMDVFEAEVQKTGLKNIDLVRVVGHSRDIMACADILMLASGTAALEAAIVGRPVVVAYKVSWFTKTLVQLLARVKYFSMPNNLVGYRLVPELMQDDCTPENLEHEVSRYLSDEAEVKKVTKVFRQIRESLDIDSDRLAAETVLEMLGLCNETEPGLGQ